MKLRKWNLMLIVPAAAFLVFSAGFCIGRQQTSGELRVLTARTPAVSAESTSSQAAQASTLIDLNTATAEELATLPGIGETIAERIVAYRQEHGSFTSLEELALIEGIGEKRIEAIRDYVTLGGTQ